MIPLPLNFRRGLEVILSSNFREEELEIVLPPLSFREGGGEFANPPLCLTQLDISVGKADISVWWCSLIHTFCQPFLCPVALTKQICLLIL